MKKSIKMLKWFKEENPIVQLTLVCSATMFLFGSISCTEQKKESDLPVDSEFYSGECDWSTLKNDFHTEGDFHNGTLWQISSYKGNYFRSDFDARGNSSRVQLKNYDEALQISKQLVTDGFGCKEYTNL